MAHLQLLTKCDENYLNKREDTMLNVKQEHRIAGADRSSIFFLKVKGLSFSITKEGGCDRFLGAMYRVRVWWSFYSVRVWWSFYSVRVWWSFGVYSVRSIVVCQIQLLTKFGEDRMKTT
ncbi:hypothetical protein DPMN_112748 [Dreissena polymorpha]|uniref:Uncharacterized protein n=1 Tax=Dreissena polymorpha TaxID=45954 RepID=A0A9D4KGW3_DREPO|nr:hypothetical protein DPMN_112748 [Dreissena polymorpha]